MHKRRLQSFVGVLRTPLSLSIAIWIILGSLMLLLDMLTILVNTEEFRTNENVLSVSKVDSEGIHLYNGTVIDEAVCLEVKRGYENLYIDGIGLSKSIDQDTLLYNLVVQIVVSIAGYLILLIAFSWLKNSWLKFVVISLQVSILLLEVALENIYLWNILETFRFNTTLSLISFFAFLFRIYILASNGKRL